MPTLAAKVDEDYLKRVQDQAQREGITVSQLVIRATERYLDAPDPVLRKKVDREILRQLYVIQMLSRAICSAVTTEAGAKAELLFALGKAEETLSRMFDDESIKPKLRVAQGGEDVVG